MNEIDYQEKFVNFQAITENHDPDVAMRYLQEANWDENEASKNYFKQINNNNHQNTNVSNNMERDFYKQNLISNTRNPVRNNSDQVNNINPTNRIMSVNSNNSRQPSQSGGLIKSIKALFCCGQTREEEEETTLTLSVFDNFTGTCEDLKEFSSKITEKIGIIIIYQEKNREFNNFIEKIKTLDHIMDILKENYTIFPTIAESDEHKRINFLLGIKPDDVVIPSMIYVSHKYSSNVHLTRQSVIESILGQISTEIFYENLVKCVETVHMQNNSNTNSRLNNQFTYSNNIHQQKNNFYQPHDSHSVIIQEQKEELMNLMREEEDKKRRQIEEQKKIEREKEEQKRLEIEKEELRKKKKNNLPEEPQEGNKEATLIVFRYSDGTGRSERRFLRTEKVSVLYDFVDTLGDIFLESDKYDLIQSFPMKIYHDKNKTLEEEGLHPNAVLQIREI